MDAALVKAIRTVEKKKRKQFLIHVIEQCYEDNKLIPAILDRVIAKLANSDDNEDENTRTIKRLVFVIQNSVTVSPAPSQETNGAH